MPINSQLKKKTKSVAVKTVQEQMLALGIALPRFGADGVLGDETLDAFGLFLVSQKLRQETDGRPDEISVEGAGVLQQVFDSSKLQQPSSAIVDERLNHPHSGRSVATPYRKWKNVTAIVLHQTASLIGEIPERWHGVPIHFGVTREGKIIQLYGLTEVCNHANGLNGRSVGIEIDGWYCGVEGKPKTLWQPKGANPPRTPMDLPTVQANAAKEVVKHIIDVVGANGGAVTHIHPHRQSSEERRSDPGSLIWKTVGLWAKTQFGLKDGGATFTVGTGLVIPEDWDSAYVKNRY